MLTRSSRHIASVLSFSFNYGQLYIYFLLPKPWVIASKTMGNEVLRNNFTLFLSFLLSLVRINKTFSEGEMKMMKLRQ